MSKEGLSVEGLRTSNGQPSTILFFLKVVKLC